MLPDSIGSLLQLRYLDLSHTGIKSLPHTTCNLYNFQTLILSGCTNIIELPIHIRKLINLHHLDISGTGIKELPMQIAGLENLQTMTDFIVGKQEVGLSIRELGKFPSLRGKLFIKNLHNVIDVVEAYDANLKSKEQIEELRLQWGKRTEDSRTRKLVLDELQPSISLKKLRIDLYGGTSFPSWLGDSSFSNMVSLWMRDCEYCVTLPSLGQLPSLKDLSIVGMRILETIGPEFYGMAKAGSNSSFQPFQSLEYLQFRNMSSWKEWLPFEGGKFPFPRLKMLRLNKCPKLRGHLPSHLSSIEEIEIDGCSHLLETSHTLHCLSSIKKINILVDLDSQGSGERTQWSLLRSNSPCLLQHVSISYCDTLLFLPEMILSSTCLQHLQLHNIPSLTAFPTDGLPTSLQSLDIAGCENLAFLPPERWSNYTSLVTLSLMNSCDALTSFALDGFPVLQSLKIEGCKCLRSIFVSESSPLRPSSLRSLSVSSCKALRSLPQRMETLTTLRRLTLSHCYLLRSLPQRMDTLTALEHLTLYGLKETEISFCEGDCLPPKLESIHIDSLSLKMPVTEWGLQGMNTLSELDIDGDVIVKDLLKERLLPISLVSLRISYLSEMKSFEGNGLRHLSSMQELRFDQCRALESLQDQSRIETYGKDRN